MLSILYNTKRFIVNFSPQQRNFLLLGAPISNKPNKIRSHLTHPYHHLYFTPPNTPLPLALIMRNTYINIHSLVLLVECCCSWQEGLSKSTLLGHQLFPSEGGIWKWWCSGWETLSTRKHFFKLQMYFLILKEIVPQWVLFLEPNYQCYIISKLNQHQVTIREICLDLEQCWDKIHPCGDQIFIIKVFEIVIVSVAEWYWSI